MISEASRPGQMVGEGEKAEVLHVASSKQSPSSSLTPATAACKPSQGKTQFMVASASPSLCMVITLWLSSGHRRGVQEGVDPTRGDLLLLEAGMGLGLPRYSWVHQSGMS